jgi:type IV pilus assembly protein PilQ
VTGEPTYTPGFKREWYNTGANLLGSGEFSTNAPSGWRPTLGLALGWLTDGGLGILALDASLALGESDGKVHIISAPKVLTVNGGTAVISRGKVEYFEIRTLDTVDMKEIPALLSLTVTPTVSADNSHITMLVEVQDDRAIPALRPGSEGGIEIPPGRISKSITTSLMVRTGDTIVIGGIYQEETRTAETGVPWLKEVPILGWLFKAERDERSKVELLIFLTPTVVTTPEVDMAQKGQT